MRTLARDLRHAARSIRRTPGFTAIVVFTLALGIGANAAIFSVAHVALLHPLPYDRPDQIVLVTTVDSKGKQGGAQPADFLDWRAQNRVFEHLAAKIDWTSYRLTDNSDPVEVVGSPVSATFFPLLRVQPIVGRAFLEGEDQPGAPGAAIISEQLWESRYRRDPRILSRSIKIDGRPYTVVGVMPAGFSLHETRGERRDQLWIPFAQQFDARQLAIRETTYQLRVWARLKSGITLDQAQAEMDVIAHRLEQQNPKTNTGRRIRLVQMQAALTARLNPHTRVLLGVLLGTVGFVLLIACANVANLLLARGASRGQEIAIRLAIGAGRARIVQQLLAESLLLAAIGGFAGLLLASWGIQLLPVLAPANLVIPRLDQLRIDRFVVAFTAVVSVATAVLFGLAPAIQAARRDINLALKQDGGPGRPWLRSTLVVAEVALSIVLLTGAGLLMTTFLRLLQTNTGIRTEHVLTLRVPAPDREMQRFERQPFYEELLGRVESVPGVRSAALATSLPFTGTDWLHQYMDDTLMKATSRRVSPGYFTTLGIPVRAGRVFTEGDTATGPPVVVINEAMAHQYWPGQNPIGRQIREADRHDRLLPDGAAATIIGVVGDTRQKLEADSLPEVYFSLSQTGNYTLGTTLVVRTGSAPLSLVPAIREQVQALDRSQPVMQIATLDHILHQSIAPQRFNMILLAVFAAMAVSLACAGIYAVITFSVSRRTREIGIRMALGARGSDIGKLVLRQGLTAAFVGIAIGSAGALGLTRILASQLYGVSPHDPLTFLVVALTLLALAAAASYLPARRAARVDPVVALRHE